MTATLKIMPVWDKFAGEFTGTVVGFPEWGTIRGGRTLETLAEFVGKRLAACNPPQEHFTIIGLDTETKAYPPPRPDIAA